jgi:methylenetetrahydrofolate--tRNA-(uracil-5-)-methyltransferase
MTDARVAIIGGGLAGCEAAMLLARAAVPVTLYEMKPARRSPAHVLDGLAELVCSNSLRSDAPDTGPGILKAELRLTGSFLLAQADEARVPAGTALAVDRERFSEAVTAALEAEPLVTIVRQEVRALDEVAEPHQIVASGPLTADGLAADLTARLGAGHLAFYDAIAPIVDAASLDMDRLFFASRWGKGAPEDYLNAPMDQATYEAFVQALLGADRVAPRTFEDAGYFSGCQPVEEIARRGAESLAFGPMKPVGLEPPSGGRAHAVVQLRREDRAGQAYNLVGFQTRLPQADQREVFHMIPGLERARFLRYGSIHRNTFLDHPAVADASLRLVREPSTRLAGQLTGVEGYIESIASGALAALFTLAELRGAPLTPPPPTTASGGLLRHLLTPAPRYQPTNIHMGLIEPVPWRRGVKKRDRRRATGQRALEAFSGWWSEGARALTTAPTTHA